MGHSRLNNLMLIHMHQDRTDNMDLKLVANDFIKNKEEKIFLHCFDDHMIYLMSLPFRTYNFRDFFSGGGGAY